MDWYNTTRCTVLHVVCWVLHFGTLPHWPQYDLCRDICPLSEYTCYALVSDKPAPGTWHTMGDLNITNSFFLKDFLVQVSSATWAQDLGESSICEKSG